MGYKTSIKTYINWSCDN